MSNQWTPDQKKVIDLRNRNLLVSAAAGSGKTAVLIERILNLISDPVRPVDIDELLVVTFTRAAAGEMRERLNTAIEKKLSEGEEEEHLTRQLTLIQSAQITTIDSFCSYILKSYFHVIGLDPNYRVMDEGEGKLLKTQVVQELLESYFEDATPEFQEFVECLATGKNDQILEDSILRLYEFAMSYPYPEKWLEECLSVYSARTMEEFENAGWLQGWLNSTRELIGDLEELLEKALSICKENGGPYLYEPAILSDLENLEKCKGAKGYREFYQAFQSMDKWARLSTKKDETIDENKKKQVKALRDQVKDEIKALEEDYFAESPETEFADMQAAGRPMKVLVELTLAFTRRFAEEKRARNLCDFHDMEHLALSILVDEEGQPTDTAKELSGRFKEIMIDEYQDSNLVQEAILTAVSREHEGLRNIFMVGDVKQSIYRFRLARPELFLEKYETYTLEDSDCQRIDLKKNFRSRREILAFTNEIFREVMRQNPGKILYFGANFIVPDHVLQESTLPENNFPYSLFGFVQHRIKGPTRAVRGHVMAFHSSRQQRSDRSGDHRRARIRPQRYPPFATCLSGRTGKKHRNGCSHRTRRRVQFPGHQSRRQRDRTMAGRKRHHRRSPQIQDPQRAPCHSARRRPTGHAPDPGKFG